MYHGDLNLLKLCSHCSTVFTPKLHIFKYDSVMISYIRAFQPVAHGPHAAREAILCGPRSHIHFNSISCINEIMRPESTILRSSAQLIHCNG